MGLPDTYLTPAKSKISVSKPADIPAIWPRFRVRKNTPVNIRRSNGVEEFTVSWQDAVLVSDPALDLIITQPNGKEYPIKKDIFWDTYVAQDPDFVFEWNDETFDFTGINFVKKAESTLVGIPSDIEVEIHTLEGVLPSVTYPDYIAIGPKDELYANTAEFAKANLTFL